MQSKTFSAIVLALAFFFFQTTAGWTIPWGFKRDAAPLKRGPSPDFRHHHHHHHHHHTGTGTGFPAPTGTVVPPFPLSNSTTTVGPTGTSWPTPTGF